jgi:hypothetical protein
MLAQVARLDMECKQYNLVTVFLNALIEKHKMFVGMPHGFEQYAQNGQTQKICLLKRALYGLEKSLLLWYEELPKFLCSIDLLLMATRLELIEKLATLLGARYDMKELGDVEYSSDVALFETGKYVRFGSSKMPTSPIMVKRFAIEIGNRKRLTPMKAGTEIVQTHADFNATKRAKKQYQELVGSTMWPATIPRGDISATVGKLSMYFNNPTTSHFEAAVHCIEYLLATKNDGICFDGNKLELEGFVDASWADNSDDRRSTCGFVFKFSGGPVPWKSNRQSIIATSTTEAEYVAMNLTARETAALRRLVSEVL